MKVVKSLTSLSSISMFQADSATSTTRNSPEMSRVSTAATPRFWTHLPMPTRTVNSVRLPGDGDGQGPIGVDDPAQEAALLGLHHAALLARRRGLDGEALLLEVVLDVRLQRAQIGPLAGERLLLVADHGALLGFGGGRPRWPRQQPSPPVDRAKVECRPAGSSATATSSTGRAARRSTGTSTVRTTKVSSRIPTARPKPMTRI